MIVVKRKTIHYEHPVVYQKDFEENGELNHSPIFIYYMSEATQDEQMAWSFNPVYVMKLEGHFDATTKPLIIKDIEDEQS